MTTMICACGNAFDIRGPGVEMACPACGWVCKNTHGMNTEITFTPIPPHVTRDWYHWIVKAQKIDLTFDGLWVVRSQFEWVTQDGIWTDVKDRRGKWHRKKAEKVAMDAQWTLDVMGLSAQAAIRKWNERNPILVQKHPEAPAGN